MKESYLELGLEYFKTEGIKLSHTTDSSSGDIDVEQVVKGEEDIFFSESPERTLEKKKIIVTDWDVFGSNLNTGQYRSKKTSFYKQLLGDGFELYTYYNGSLKRLNSIDDLSIFWIRIASDRLIKDIAAKMGFSSNEILIIGPISILPFINENEYSVKVSDLVNDFNSEEGSYMNALFSEILEKGSIKLTLVADSTIDYDAISDDLDGLDKVLSQFDKVTIDAKNFKEPKDLIDILLKLTNIKSIDFKNVEYISLDFSLKNIPSHVKEINIDGKTADITNWQEIIDSKDISIKFELETLSLSYSGSRAKTYLRLLTGDRVKVQNINLKNIGVNTHVFSQLLNAPELTIYNVHILDRPEYTLMNYIYGVRVLHFWKTNISFEWLKLVISRTAVELVIFTDLALTGIAPDFILPTSVKEIKLTNVKISFKNLNSLISKCKDLVEISLIDVDLLGEIEPINTQGAVKKIYINNLEMSFVDLKKFLKNCQHLEKLELQYADGLEDQIEEVQPTESLSDVVYSFLSGVKSYFREEVITTSHEHIEEISVRALPQTLQELDLSYSDVGPQVFQEITETLLNLQELKVVGCKNLKMLPREISIPKSYTVQGIENNFPQIDDNTGNTDSKLSYTRYFKPKPHGPPIYVADYRLKVYTEYDINTGRLTHTPHPSDFTKVKVSITYNVNEVYNTKYKNTKDYFLGKRAIPEGLRQSIIPSLHHKDELIGFEVYPYQSYSIVHCKRTDLYYLKTPDIKPNSVIYFIIKSPYRQSSFFQYFDSLSGLNPFIKGISKLRFTEENRLNDEGLYRLTNSQKIDALTTYFDGFETKAISRKSLTPRDKINTVMEERAGVCRHGAQSFKAAADALGLDTRIAGNDIHQFNELLSENARKHLDFGGATSEDSLKDNDLGWEKQGSDDNSAGQKGILDGLKLTIHYPYKMISEMASQIFNFKIADLVKGFFFGALMYIPLNWIWKSSEDARNSFDNKIENMLPYIKYIQEAMSSCFSQLYADNKINDSPKDDYSFPNKEHKDIADSSSSTPEENYVPNYDFLLIIMAAAGSTALLGVAARYFYSQSKNPVINSNNDVKVVTEKPQVVETDRGEEGSSNGEYSDTDSLDSESTDIANEEHREIVAREPDIPSANPFMPKKDKEISADNMKEYVSFVLDQAIGLDRKNILCIMEEDQIEAFYAEILAARKDSYFISDLDEVYLQNTVVNDGEITREDSKLAKFLKLPQGVLVIDWSDCQPQNIGLNSIIDTEIKVNGQRVEQRRVDVATLRQEMVVISILKKDIKLGDDFYSRQKVINTLPKELAFQVQDRVLPAISGSNQAEILFYDGDWKQKIFGRIRIEQEEGYFYRLSELHSHVFKGERDIILRNAPWEDREFRLALKDIEERGIIFANGKEYECKNIKFIRSDVPYSKEGLTRVEFDADIEYQTVNHENFQKLFEQYSIENKKLVIEEEFAKRKLLVTEDLSLSQWGKLAASGAEVLDGSKVVAGRPLKLGNEQANIVITNDLGLSRKDYAGKLIIHVNTETSVSELIEKITYDKDSRYFEHKSAVVADALLNGEEVVLVGSISRNLMNHLSSLFINKPYLMINGKRVEFTGKITLLTEKILGFDMLIKEKKFFSAEEIWDKVEEHHSFEVVVKLKELCGLLSKEVPGINSFSYTQINSILHRMEVKPDSNPFKHLLRLRPDYQKLKPILEEIWTEEGYDVLPSMFDGSYLQESRQSKPTRLEKVVSEAQISPLLFIAGPSGAGKSTFMRKDLGAIYDICEGMKSLVKLTKASPTGKPSLLFLDEANLVRDPERYGVLNGILDESRQVLIDGKLQKILEGNIIILVGNYGHFKNRNAIRVIEEHGSIISFKELSDKIIKSKIVKPILLELFHQGIDSVDSVSILDVIDVIDGVADSFIEAYHHINDMRPDEEMLTVRNIEMMCFRSKKLEHDGITDAKLRSVMSIYDEVSVKLTKSERKELRVWLERSQKLETGIIKLKKSELKDLVDIDGLFVAQSRKNIVRLLEYMTFIRELKIDNDQIDATAINGILFEGLSGSGKSYVAIKFLEHLGFRNAAKYPDSTKKYYVITPTNFMRAEADLLRLVDEGAVILVDEINTMPLEDVLNPLLSGVDLHGEFAKKKGGFVIATQNPISYGNRLVFSEAVDKRFQKIIVKDFKKPELIEMLKSMINDETWNTWIESVVDYYLEAIQYTQKYNIPSPNLRQLTEYLDYAQGEFNIVPEEVKDIQEIAVIEEVDDNNQASLAMVPYDSDKALVYTIESTTLRAINMALDFRLPNIMLPQVIELVPSILLTSQVVSDVVAEDMVLTVRVDSGEFPDIFLPAGDGSAIRFTFFGDLFESFTTRLLENTAIKAYLLNYVYGENIVAVNAILSKSYIKDSQDSGVQEILQKSPFEWSKKDFNKINLIIHPDKGGDAEDFKIIQEFKESRGPQEDLDDNLFTKAFEKFLPSMHQFISKATIGIKVFDTVIDGARLAYEPNITHVKAVALDTTYLYSMYTGVNGYSSSINLIDVSYKLYNGEYMGAIQQAAVIAAYMALPSVIAATGIPYVGLVYSSGMLGYTGYSAASNSYSFYQEFGSNDFYIKSYTAYKDVAKTLSDSLLQDFYDFKPLTKIYELNLKKLELNTQVLELKKEMQEDGSEFAQKLYKYIIEPQVERKYDLFNKVIQGIITEEQMEGLVLKVLEEIVVGTQSYNNCVEFEEQNYYCFNNKFVDHVIMGEGMDPLLIAHL